MEITKIEQFGDAGIEVLETEIVDGVSHVTIQYRGRTFLLRTRGEWPWDGSLGTPVPSITYTTDAEEVTTGAQWKCPGVDFPDMEDAIVDSVNVIIMAVDREVRA